jgi:dTMP kinase
MGRRRSRLLCLEGVTGAGKSTLCRQIRRTWNDTRNLVLLGGYGGSGRSPDPFHQDLLRSIRRQLARNEFFRVNWSAECLVIQAELLLAESALIKPALSEGSVVLYEHHMDSVLAYQAARLVETDKSMSVKAALNHVQDALAPFPLQLKPDAVVWLNVEPEEASIRAAKRDKRRLTRSARNFNEIVAAAYKALYGITTERTILEAASAANAMDLLLELTTR